MATRLGIEAFTSQLHTEALLRGLPAAERVLVVADGAVWIWNLLAERFPGAAERLDLWHALEHLWELARGFHPQNPRAWIDRIVEDLKDHSDGASRLLEALEELGDLPAAAEAGQAELLAKKTNYFTHNAERMNYAEARDRGEPLGSGAIESTCSQYQRRFKLTGQFWTLEGDESLLALQTLHRNERWHLLFPHDTSARSPP